MLIVRLLFFLLILLVILLSALFDIRFYFLTLAVSGLELSLDRSDSVGADGVGVLRDVSHKSLSVAPAVSEMGVDGIGSVLSTHVIPEGEEEDDNRKTETRTSESEFVEPCLRTVSDVDVCGSRRMADGVVAPDLGVSNSDGKASTGSGMVFVVVLWFVIIFVILQ